MNVTEVILVKLYLFIFIYEILELHRCIQLDLSRYLLWSMVFISKKKNSTMGDTSLEMTDELSCISMPMI